MPLPHRSRAKAVAVSSPLPHSKPQKKRDILEDEARFLRSWFERPLVTGAVTPSGRMLARTMASYVDPRLTGR